MTEKLSINTKVTYSAFSFNNLWQLQPNLFFKAGILDTKLGGETQLTYRFNADNTFILGFSAQQQSQSHPVADTRGIEPEGKYNFAKNTYLAFNYVYQDAKDQNQQRLANTPRHRANIIANVEITVLCRCFIKRQCGRGRTKYSRLCI